MERIGLPSYRDDLPGLQGSDEGQKVRFRESVSLSYWALFITEVFLAAQALILEQGMESTLRLLNERLELSVQQLHETSDPDESKAWEILADKTREQEATLRQLLDGFYC